MNIDAKKALCAGGIIGFSAYVNLLVDNKWLGAFLFSCGLLAICINNFQLATGRFGQLYTKELNIIDIILMFIFNVLGAQIFSIFILLSNQSMTIIKLVEPIIEKRDSLIWYQHIISGLLCGICIQLAVQNFKKYQFSALGLIMPVMFFILTSSEHCIADSFYYSYNWNLTHFIQTLEVLTGNFIGATLIILCSQDNLSPSILDDKKHHSL